MSRYVDNWRTHNHMIFNNNAPTVPQGLEMMSPESPPRGMREDEGGWDTDEFSEGEETTSHHTYSTPVYKQVSLITRAPHLSINTSRYISCYANILRFFCCFTNVDLMLLIYVFYKLVSF